MMTIPPINEMPYRKGANAILFNSSGQILIVQKVSYNENEWDLPGGGIEDNETPEDGILREINEELGLQPSDIDLIGKSTHINKFEWPMDVITRGYGKRNKWYRGQEKFQFVVKLLCSQDKIKLQEEEIRTTKWVFPKDLKTYFVFPNQFESIQNVLTEFKISI